MRPNYSTPNIFQSSRIQLPTYVAYQLTFIFRCVSDEGEINEQFVGFKPIYSHVGHVMKMIKDLEIDLSNCRGQSYDNASNMSSKYNSLQAHL